MAYPTTPVSFTPVNTGENPSATANLIGTELVAMETATLHASSQTQAPIRLRGGGNQLEWGLAAVGQLSMLGAGAGGKSFIGIGAEAGSGSGLYTTRAQPGIVIQGDNAGGLQIYSVPLVGTANQSPVLLFTVTKDGIPQAATPVVGVYSGAALSCANATYTPIPLTVSSDPFGFWQLSSELKIPAGVGLAGVYLIILSATFAANATGVRGLRIDMTQGGSTDGVLDWRLCDPTGGVFPMQVIWTRALTDGEAFKCYAYQTSGAALNMSGATLKMIKLG